MNSIGNLGGFVANILTGQILKSWVQDLQPGTQAYYDATQPAWIVCFLSFGGIYVVAVVLWSFFVATRPVVPDAVSSQDI